MSATIKTSEDIIILREAGARLARVVDEVSKMIAPGISIQELDAHAERLIREGGDVPAFLGYKPWGAKRKYPATMCISVNEEVVHGIPNEDPRTLEEGDIVSIDCGLVHKGLIADHAITAIAGAGDKEAERLMRVTKESLMAGIKAAKGGNTIGDISAAIEAIGDKNEYGIVYALGGHGVGYEVHEEPFVPNVGDAGKGVVLEAGMVLAIEPMFTEGTDEVILLPDGYTYVTKDGSRAAHFEHTVLITEGDAEILTAL